MRPPSRRERIAAQLADLKMPGALEALDGVLSGVDGGGTTAAEAIERLLAAQIELRNGRRLEAAMRSSRLPYVKTLAAFDFAFQPSIKREQIDALHELGFLERQENVVFLGPPGVGKTHLAISLAITAAESGRKIYFGTLTDLVTSLEEAKGRRQARPPPEDPHPPGAARRRRDRLPAGDPERGGPVLPTRQPALRQRLDRAHVQQGLRGVGAASSATRSWPPPCSTGCSTGATS